MSAQTHDPDDEHLPIGLTELVALMVCMTSVVALAIDMMLPALDDIAGDLGALDGNQRQYVIAVYLAGFGAAQLVYGPLSDSYGRKPVIMGALTFFLITSLICLITPSFDLMLLARFLQGAAASACRVIAIAIARDLTSGRRMAEIMSMVMTAFMAVPILAPSMGQLILLVAPWRWIFIFLMVFAGGLMVWLHFRLPETLKPENRTPLRVGPLLNAFRESMRYRLMIGYTFAAAFFFGGLYSFLGTAQQLFAEHFGLGEYFPIVFAVMAGGMGFASYMNGRLVRRMGQRRLSHGALIGFTILSGINALTLLAGVDDLVVFVILLSAAMALLGLIVANFSALALEPVGHVAGTASAVYGFVSGVLASIMGAIIGQLYDGTGLPLILGQTAMGGSALMVVLITERFRLFGTGEEG